MGRNIPGTSGKGFRTNMKPKRFDVLVEFWGSERKGHINFREVPKSKVATVSCAIRTGYAAVMGHDRGDEHGSLIITPNGIHIRLPNLKSV